MRAGQGLALSLIVAMLTMQSNAAVSAETTLRVAATVAPIHSLVAMVTEDIAEPDLIVRPGASPHGYALKPSEARALDDADVVFWVGEGLEPWMAKAVTSLAGDASVIELGEIEGILRLDSRASGVWADNHHDEDEDHASDDHGHDHGGGFDPHLWLAPENALIWLASISEALADADPANAEGYFTNAEAAAETIVAMSAEIEDVLRPIREKPYAVFHDAYQYFEDRFDLHAIGAISLGDADRPGPGGLIAIREAITKSGATCIFAEPQFEPRLIETVIEGSDISIGTLDPIGAGLTPGAELYPALMRGLAASLAECLG